MVWKICFLNFHYTITKKYEKCLTLKMTSTVTNIVTTEKNITKKGFLPLIATIGKIGDDAFSFYNVVLMCALLFFR